MAAIAVTSPANYPADFQRQVYRNVAYWQRYVTERGDDPAALEREWERIVRAISYALDSTPAWPVAYSLIEAFAPYMERRGYWENWQRLLNRALHLARRRRDEKSEANLLALLARLLYRRSYYKESVAAYRRAIPLCRRLGDSFGEGRACTNLGYYFVEQGFWHRAEVLCCHALRIFEQLGNKHGLAHTENHLGVFKMSCRGEATRRRVGLLRQYLSELPRPYAGRNSFWSHPNHLGVLYTRRGVWNEAEARLKRACAIWEVMSDKHGLMRGYTNLGFLFNEMKYPDEAIFYLQKALTQAKRVGEEIIIGTIYINIGSAHKLKGDLDKAETYYLQAETIFHRFSSLVYMGDIYEYLGWLYLDQQRWPDARQHLEQALKIWRTIDNKYGEIRTLIHLIEYEQARGDQVQASTWLKKVDDLLEQYDATGQYYQLRQQVSEIRRDLAEWSRGNNSK